MNECRSAASSVVYQGRMIVTGGLPKTEMPNDTTINVEELNLAKQNAHCIESPFELPFQELYGHVRVVDHNRLLVIGGRFNREVKVTIHEFLTSPTHRRCLAI